MTLDEFKKELEALALKVDDDLALEVAKEGSKWWTVTQIFPKDHRTTKPENGVILRLGIDALFECAQFTYEEKV
jgi:hypothetical protein